MWIFMSDSFLSIVAHRTKPGILLVRARLPGDIKRVFPQAKVTVTPSADYMYRSELKADVVAARIAESIVDIDYDNFKNSISDPDRHDACMTVWSAMYRLQRPIEIRQPPLRKKTAGARSG